MKSRRSFRNKHPSSLLQQSVDPGISNDRSNVFSINFQWTVGMNKTDCESCIESLDVVENNGNNLMSFFIEELEKAKSMTSVEDLKDVIENLNKRVQDCAPIIIDCASKSKSIFVKLLEVINNLNMVNSHLESEINEIKKTMNDLHHELVNYKEKAEELQVKMSNKISEQANEIEKVKEDKKQADIKINHLEGVVAKLNDHLKITEEDQAKLLIRQVINVVPTQMYWKIFSEKKRNKKTFWLSEIDCHLKKLPEITEFDKKENSKKVALFEEFREALGGDWKEMEHFMKKFKDDVGGNQVAHPLIASKNKILDAVDVLTKSQDIDEDDAVKISILANVWEDLNK